MKMVINIFNLHTKPSRHPAAARPTASGPDPFRSLLELSMVANTVMMSTKVMINSTATPCMGLTPGPNTV